MDSLSGSTAPRRWWLLGCGGLLGLLASFVASGSSGCVYPDKCIRVTSAGHDWCRNLSNALQWPADGGIADAEPVLRANGAAPQGCRCFNDAEHQILEDEVPACSYDVLLEELELAARQECQSLVTPGYDHNCWTATGSNASIAEGEFPDGQGNCIGNCEYGGQPSGSSCPELNPYECATGDGGYECDPEAADSSTGESSASSGGLFDPSSSIHCEGDHCEIDEHFARALYSDPSRLLSQRTRLVYDAERQRHIIMGVPPGSLAHALGLYEGDVLESINGLIINDLDAALRAYAESQDAPALHIRIGRGPKWIDFTYTFVR